MARLSQPVGLRDTVRDRLPGQALSSHALGPALTDYSGARRHRLLPAPRSRLRTEAILAAVASDCYYSSGLTTHGHARRLRQGWAPPWRRRLTADSRRPCPASRYSHSPRLTAHGHACGFRPRHHPPGSRLTADSRRPCPASRYSHSPRLTAHGHACGFRPRHHSPGSTTHRGQPPPLPREPLFSRPTPHRPRPRLPLPSPPPFSQPTTHHSPPIGHSPPSLRTYTLWRYGTKAPFHPVDGQIPRSPAHRLLVYTEFSTNSQLDSREESHLERSFGVPSVWR